MVKPTEYNSDITLSQVDAGSAAIQGIATRSRARALAPQALHDASADTGLSSLTPVPEDGADTTGSHEPVGEELPLSRSSDATSADVGRLSRARSVPEDRGTQSPVPRASAEGHEVPPTSSDGEDTLDSDGFVVPKRVARAQRREAERMSPTTSVGKFFNSKFYDPDNEPLSTGMSTAVVNRVAEAFSPSAAAAVPLPASEASVSEMSSPSTNPDKAWDWADGGDDADPFGPIPEDWKHDVPVMHADPYADMPLDWMKPQSVSTPIRNPNATVFDDLLEIALDSMGIMSGMSPRSREIIKQRQLRMKDAAVGSSETSLATDSKDGGPDAPEMELIPGLKLAAITMTEADKPRYTAAQKGKGKAPPDEKTLVTAPSSSRRVTIEEVVDDDDPRAAQLKYDAEMAQELQEREYTAEAVATAEDRAPPRTGPRPSRTKMVTIRYHGTDDQMYEVDMPIDRAFAQLGISPTGTAVKREEISVAETPKPQETPARERVSRRSRSAAQITQPLFPVASPSRALGSAANLMRPELQMPLNSALSASYDRIQRRKQRALSGGPSDPPSSSSSSDGSSSESDESSPSSASSHDSEGTRRRKRAKRKAWKSKQRKLRLELAATKPEPPEKYDGSPDWDKYSEFLILTRKYLKAAFVDRRRQVSKMQYLLTGKARKYYLGSVAGKEKQWTLDELFVALFNYCFPANFRTQQRERFASYKQLGLSVKEFQTKLRSMAESIGDITDAHFGSRFIAGLRLEIREKVTMEGFSGETHHIDIISDYAQRVEATFAASAAEGRRVVNALIDSGPRHRSERSNAFRKSGGRERNRESTNSTTPAASSSQSQRKDGAKTGEKSKDSPKSKLTKEQRDQYRADGRCFECGETGHLGKDCKKRNSVKKPESRSLRGARLNLEEAQTRHALKKAAGMGFLAMRHVEPCEDGDLLRLRDEVYGHWLSRALIRGVPYPSDPETAEPDATRFSFERWYFEPHLFDIHDRTARRTYTIDAATLFSTDTDIVEWLTLQKRAECAEQVPQGPEVDWNTVFAQSDHWRHVAIDEAAADAEASPRSCNEYCGATD